MAEDVVSLAERRADATGDSRAWTPLECLKALVRDMEAGKRDPSMVYVAMRQEVPPNAWEARYFCAGGGTMEYMGMLFQHLRELSDRQV